MRKQLPAKVKFEFDEIEALMDVYTDGVKIRNGHNCQKGHVYFHCPQDTDIELRPHDPRVQVEAEFTPEGLQPVVNLEELESKAAAIEAKAKSAAMKEAKKEAAKRMEAAKKEREFKQKSTLVGNAGAVLKKPQAPTQ